MVDLAPRARRWASQVPAAEISLVHDVDRYESAECQFGAHHACPGGIRKGTEGQGIVRLACQCTATTCACCLRRSAVEKAPRLHPQGAGES